MDQLSAMRAFLRVVETGNFTRASTSLNMPKATISNLIQGLEAHLGTKLLNRTTRRVLVTPDGADLVVLDKNPLEDISNSRTLRYTMVNGRLYDANTLNEVGTRQRTRAKFFFEKDGNEGWSPQATTHATEQACD